MSAPLSIGSAVNFWTLLEPTRKANRNGSRTHAAWRCLCICGEERVVLATNLQHGKALSCGCEAKSRTHGETVNGRQSHEYKVWNNMLRRCFDPANEKYHRYGGRGITVCDRWRDVRLFIEDMGRAPPGHTLERIDNDGNYEPGNCRWATPLEQAANTSNNRHITANGKTMILAEWARELGVPSQLLSVRLRRGMSEEESVTRPIILKGPRKEREPSARPGG